MTQTTATAKQVSYIRSLEAKAGRKWTEFVACPAGATLEQMPKAIASKVISALLAECPKPAKATAARKSYTRYSGQSGRCYDCGAPLNHLAAGGYCFDCQ